MTNTQRKKKNKGKQMTPPTTQPTSQPPHERTQKLATRISGPVADRLHAVAKAEGRSISWLVTQALDRYLNPPPPAP